MRENHYSCKINNRKIYRKVAGYFEHQNGFSDSEIKYGVIF
jgi:hypothetical protein